MSKWAGCLAFGTDQPRDFRHLYWSILDWIAINAKGRVKVRLIEYDSTTNINNLRLSSLFSNSAKNFKILVRFKDGRDATLMKIWFAEFSKNPVDTANDAV